VLLTSKEQLRKRSPHDGAVLGDVVTAKQELHAAKNPARTGKGAQPLYAEGHRERPGDEPVELVQTNCEGECNVVDHTGR
jgi:hypothetical protein